MLRAFPLALAALLFAGAACGCGGGAEAESCARRAGALAERIAREHEDARLERPPEVDLPPLPGPADPLAPRRWLGPRLPMLTASEEELWLDGRGLGGLGEGAREATARALTQDLRALVRLRLRRGGEERPVALWLWADPALPAATLGELMRAQPDAVLLHLLVREPLPEEPAWAREGLAPPPPPPEAIPEEQAHFSSRALAAQELGGRLRRRLRGAAGRCAPLAEAGEAILPLGLEPAREPEPELVGAALREAMSECGCRGINLPALTTLAVASAWGADGAVRRLPRPIRIGGCDRPELALSELSSVGELALRAAHLGERGGETPICVGDL